MNTDKSKNTEGLKETNSKMPWSTPELVDLDINVATENASKGPSGGDLGGFFNDYNS